MKKQLKNVLNCCELFKSKTRLGNNFRLKDQIPKNLTSNVVYKFQCGLRNESYHGKYVRHLNVTIGEHIGTLPLPKKQVKPENRSVANHLSFRNHSASSDNFRNLTRENKKTELN